MGLQWDDVDLDEGVIAIDRSTTQLGKRLVTTTPKNHERRNMSIDGHLVATLRTWKAQQAAERLSWGAAYADSDDAVFTWEDGRRVQPDYVTKLIGREQRRLDLPLLSLHELRHTHATILLRAGTPVHIVSRRLGHRDPSVTPNAYAEVIPSDDASAVDAFLSAVCGAWLDPCLARRTAHDCSDRGMWTYFAIARNFDACAAVPVRRPQSWVAA